MTELRRRRIQGVAYKLPGMITCAVFEGFICDYLDGTLPTRERRLFEIHLFVCGSCRRYLANYRKTLAAVKMLAKEDKAALENIPEDLIAAVIAARSVKNE